VSRAITVLEPGPLALVQDLGRPGYAHLGVPPSGALDIPALTLANRLVGNPESAAGIETMGNLVLRAESSCTIAITGPPLLKSTVDTHQPVYLAPGQQLRLGGPSAGLRCYIGVSGGIEVPPELGSRATDVLSGIGPKPLSVGDTLPLGPHIGEPSTVDGLPPERVPSRLELPVLLGPREDWFDDPAGQLAAGVWTASPRSNRIGLRLDGTALRRAEQFRDVELPSEPVITGAIQVPPDGRPVIFLADHPTTGGYPVIGVVHPRVLPLLAQARPGTPVRLRPDARSA